MPYEVNTRVNSKRRKTYCGAQINAFLAHCSWMGIAIETPTALLPLRCFDDVKEPKKREKVTDDLRNTAAEKIPLNFQNVIYLV